jgi:hypothetical protein
MRGPESVFLAGQMEFTVLAMHQKTIGLTVVFVESRQPLDRFLPTVS